jgi:aspartate aminotransferase
MTAGSSPDGRGANVLIYQSSRQASVSDSETVAASRRAQELRESGIDVISLTVGEPDFPTPAHVVEAAHRAALEGKTRYVPVLGTTELRVAIAHKFARDNRLPFNPANEIIVGTGGKQVVFNAFAVSMEPGDEVVIPAPHWVSYPAMVAMAGGVPRIVPTNAEDGYIPTPEQLERAMSPRTRWLVLNFPGNPTGAVASRAQLEGIANVLRRHPQVLIMSDEIYEHICFDGVAPLSIAAVAPDLRERILLVNGVSKAYAMTGWRIGFGAGPAPLIKAMAKMQSQTTGGACSISQAAAAAALDGPTDFLAERSRMFQSRRDAVLARLVECPTLVPFRPQGAFYLLCEVIGADAQEVEERLLSAGVAVVGGSAFGAPNHIRLSIATSQENLDRACDRIIATLA